jgi:hypothetical protein
VLIDVLVIDDVALLRVAVRAPGNRAPVVGLFLQRALNGSGYMLAILGHGKDLTCGKLVRTYFTRTVPERMKADRAKTVGDG